MYTCVRTSAPFLFYPMVRLQDAMNSDFSRPDSIVDAYHDTPLRWMPFDFRSWKGIQRPSMLSREIRCERAEFR